MTTNINPIQTNGFELLEYTAPTMEGIENLKKLFTQLGFTEIAKHHSQAVWLFKQNDLHFLVNAENNMAVKHFAEVHGPSVYAMGWRVKNAQQALQYCLENGAKETENNTLSNSQKKPIPTIQGIGGSIIYLIEEYRDNTLYLNNFEFYANYQEQLTQNNKGLLYLDHVTHNVHRGHMEPIAQFYENIANFKEIRYFDIEGKLTGLVSKAMTSPCGKIRIPINESSDDKSQIEEFLKEYNGEGIQHIAMATDDIYHTVEMLKKQGVEFLFTPNTYYEKVNQRVPGHHEDLERMKALKILIDGMPSKEGILLQIFTQTVIGPVFFEIIQRKGNEGFGEGNFKALFESIEEDQIKRGVL